MKEGTGASAYNWIPTNFPTRTLKLVIYITNGLHVVSLPSSFAPSVGKKVEVIQYLSGSCTNYLRYGSSLIYNTGLSSGSSWLGFKMDWDPTVSAWTVSVNALAGRPYSFVGTERYDPVPPNMPSTVEEWLELYNGATE